MPHLLDALTVLDPNGRTIRLGELWADRPAVLVFVRHFGCLFCREQIAGMAPLRARVRSRGGELFVIGHGSVDQARAFQEEQAVSFPLFTDPDRRAYCALGMRRGIRSVLTPGVLMRSMRAWRNGFRQSHVAGDPLQQGGVVVIAPGGTELYRFVSHEAGQHAPAPEILSALEGAS